MPAFTGYGGLWYQTYWDHSYQPPVEYYGDENCFPPILWSATKVVPFKPYSELVGYRGKKERGVQHPVYHYRRSTWFDAIVHPTATHPFFEVKMSGENHFTRAYSSPTWWWRGNGYHTFLVTADRNMYNPDYSSHFYGPYYMKLSVRYLTTEYGTYGKPLEYPMYKQTNSFDLYIGDSGNVTGYSSCAILGWDYGQIRFPEYDYQAFLNSEKRGEMRQEWLEKAAEIILMTMEYRYVNHLDHLNSFLGRPLRYTRDLEHFQQPVLRRRNAGSLFNERHLVEYEDIPCIKNADLLEKLTRKAYLDALEDIPSAGKSNLVNLLEIISLTALVAGGFTGTGLPSMTGIPTVFWELIRMSWLAGRYQINTATMDATELSNFIVNKLYEIPDEMTLHGVARDVVEDTPVVVRCTLTCRYKPSMELKRIWAWLRIFGLQPNWYQWWDITPFSFMVDWFIPVSEFVDSLDWDQTMKTGLWDVSSPVYSIKYTKDLDDYNEKYYTRWIGKTPRSLVGACFPVNMHKSAKTWIMRVFDAATIFIGGKWSHGS